MKGMTLIVKTTVRFLLGFIVLFGLNIVLTGHLKPGSGFAGGVILAAGLLLLVLAFGADEMKERLGHRLAVVWEAAGGLVFLILALLGFIAGAFFASFLPRLLGTDFLSAGSIPLANVAIALHVGAGLFGAFLVIVGHRMLRSDGRDRGQ